MKVGTYDQEERLLVMEDGQSWDGMAKIILGGQTYYVKLHEEKAKALHLLSEGAETAEDAYQLQRLIQMLRSRTFVIAVDDEGEILEGTTARGRFLAALKEAEEAHAHSLRQVLQEVGEEW